MTDYSQFKTAQECAAAGGDWMDLGFMGVCASPMAPPGEEPAKTPKDTSDRALLPPDFNTSTRDTPTYEAQVPVFRQPGMGPGGGAPIGSEGVTPRYFKNDQAQIWQGTGGMLPRNMSPESVTAYQRLFVEAGLLSEGSYHPGEWGQESIDANEVLLEGANVNGLSADQMLNRLRSSMTRLESTSGGGGSGRLPPTIRLSNPDDLRAIFKQTARQTLGGVFAEDDQLDGMVKSFQEQERAFQLAAAGGGEGTSSPSAQTFAEGEFEASDPGGADANRFQSMTRVLQNLVGEANG